MEKINNIPKGWKEYKLGEVCDINLGLTHTPIYVEEGIPFVSVKDISNTKLELSTTKRISRAEFESFPKGAKPRKGDVLFCRVGTIGHSQIVTTDEPFGIFVSVGFLRMKSSSIINKYIKYWMDSYCFTSQVEMEVKGGTRKNLNTGWLKNFSISIPPTIDEQSAIVSRIESSFSRLDSGIATLQKVQKQLAVYRLAVLNKYLTINNPQWEYVPIYDVIKIINSGSTPKSDKMYSSGEIQFLKVYNLTFDGTINLSKDPVFIDRETHESLLKRSRAKAGDVLINIVGPPLGKVSIIPDVDKEFNINQAIVMFRPNELVLSKFLAYYLMSPQVIAWLTSTSKATAGQHNVKVSTCREIMFPKVPILEQTRIVEQIESRLSVCDSIEKTVTESLRQAEVLRQSILKEAFEGRL